eukprot:1488376-Rhodomonas_salina.1
MDQTRHRSIDQVRHSSIDTRSHTSTGLVRHATLRQRPSIAQHTTTLRNSASSSPVTARAARGSAASDVRALASACGWSGSGGG